MSATLLGPAATEDPADQRTEWSAYRVAVVAMCVVTFGWRAWTTSRWTWNADDWLYMADTRSMSFSHYLFQDYNGHLMPAGFLVSWVVTKLAPLEYWAPVLLVAAAAAASVWVWGRALVALAGERLILLAPLALLAFSPLMIRPTIWWASALQVLPLQIALALVVLAATRVAASHSRRDLGRLLLALLVGLAFWEKAILLVIPATALLLHTGPGPFRSRLRRQALPLAAMAGLSVAYLAIYTVLTRTAAGDREMGVQLDAERSLSAHVEFFGRGLGDLLAPALLGGPWHTLPVEGDPYARPPLAVVVLSLVAVGLAVAWAARRVRRTWIPVVMVLGYFVVSCGLLLYSERFDVLGTLAISDERYLADPMAVAVLGIAMALGGPVRRTGASPTRAARWGGGALAAALAVSLVGANVGAAMKIGSRPSRPWVANVMTDIDRRQPVTLLDTYAPPKVLQAFYFGEEARLSRMLAPLHADLSFGVPAQQLWSVDDDGHLQEVVVADDSHAAPGPVEGCGYAMDVGTSQTVRLTRTLYSWEWVVQVNAFAATGGTLTVDIDGSETTVVVPDGLTQHQFAYVGSVPKDVRLSMTEGQGTVCVTDLIIGTAGVAE